MAIHPLAAMQTDRIFHGRISNVAQDKRDDRHGD